MVTLAALALATGCASNRLGPFGEEETVREIQARPAAPMELKIALAPVVIDYTPTPLGTAPDAQEWSAEMGPSAVAAVQEEIREALGQKGLFRDLLVLPDDPGQDRFQAAWDDRADLLLEVRVTRRSVSWAGTTGWYIPNIALWGYFWAPSWWVADERYRSVVGATVKIRSVHTGETVWEKAYEPQVERELDDWERGWMLGGIFRVPDALGPENWEKIDRVVTPFAVRKLALEIYGDLDGEFREFQNGPEFSSKMTKTLALLVGISKYRYRKIRNVGYADRDAAGLRDVLANPGPGGAIPQNILLLVDEAATKQGILGALEGFLATRAEYPDRVIIYFGGNGGSWGKRPYFLPWDFDPDQPDETALDLGTLKERLGGITCTNLVTIFDCSFQGEEDGRCFALPGLEKDPVAQGPIEGLASKEHRRWVLLGAAPEQSANEQDSLQNGIFSHFLLDALGGKADGDGDGAVTLEEVFRFVRDLVDRQSQVTTGRDQNPRLIPEPVGAESVGAEFPLTWPSPGDEPPG